MIPPGEARPALDDANQRVEDYFVEECGIDRALLEEGTEDDGFFG